MDLIDYQPRPISNTRDEDNSNSSEEEHNNPHMRYILHIKDHFAKWSWAFPLRSKQPSLVVKNLRKVFYMASAPLMLQSDNGGEFVNSLVVSRPDTNRKSAFLLLLYY